MPVEYKDDGKGKAESHSATIDLKYTNLMNGGFMGSMVGFGPTQDEARRNLLETAHEMTVAVAKAAMEAYVPGEFGHEPIGDLAPSELDSAGD